MLTSQLAKTDARVAHRQTPRLAINRLGLWLFIISESFLFAAVISARYYLQGLHRPDELNQPLGLAITAVLLLSSLSAYRAETAGAHGDQVGLRRSLLATIGLAVIFLVGVAIEWAEGFHLFPPSTGFGTVFFSLTGLHAFHVLTGTVVLALVYRASRDGRFGPGNNWPVEGAVKYWHFVDVVWVFVYPTLYLAS